MHETIKSLSGAFSALSNFAPTPIALDGIVYPTAEHAFQAAKAQGDRAAQERIARLPKPGQAKRAGGPRAPAAERIALPAHWDRDRISVMRAILEQKFAQNSAAAAVLESTGSARIEEGNAHNDTFWGVSFRTGRGANHLGQILEQIRAARRAL